MELCVSQMKGRLTWDNLAERLMLADRINHPGLHKACVEFVVQSKDRYVHQSSISHISSSDMLADCCSMVILISRTVPKEACLTGAMECLICCTIMSSSKLVHLCTRTAWMAMND